MKLKNLLLIFACIITLSSVMPITASADIGPKPSVTVRIKGLDGEKYSATLLSKNKSTGPASVYDGTNARYKQGDDEYEIWDKFSKFTDSDSFYFLQNFWECSGDDEFKWGYYPPNTFKILLYFPETDTFAVSRVYERYAFDSYYTINFENMDIKTITANTPVTAEQSYDYSLELISLIVRIVFTILIELAIALLFGFSKKNQLCFLAVINIITQIILNVLLNIINYSQGQYAFVFFYVILELVVFGIEAVLYSTILRKMSSDSINRSKIIVYAFAANITSFVLGMWLAYLVPGIF